MTKLELEKEVHRYRVLTSKSHTLFLKYNQRIDEIEKLYNKQQKAVNEVNKLSKELSKLIITFRDLEQETIKEYEANNE